MLMRGGVPSTQASHESEKRAMAQEGRDCKDRTDVCLFGEWSFTTRPLVHVSHTWMLERRALVGCEWTLLTSRRFGSQQDDDVTWTISLELDPTTGSNGCNARILRAPDSARVCIAFSTEVPHKRVFFRASLRAQQEAVLVDSLAASSSVLDAAGPGEVDMDDLLGMTRADPMQRQHVGDVFIVASERTLTLRVDIAYLADTKEAHCGPASVSLSVPPCSLANDMEDLLQDADLSDVVLVAEGREFPAHKAILSARSAVFAAMFKHDMAEANSNRVVVRDVSGEVLHSVLRYMYTGRVDHIRDLGVDMLAVADRYALPRLKALCEEELANSVDVDNALEVLVTADVYAAKELRDSALHFVCSNIHRLLPTQSWRDLQHSRPHLLHLVLAKCVNCTAVVD